MKVSVIGCEDSGQTVFVSLLFAAQIKLSEEKKSGFRFSSSPSCQARIGEAYNMIRGGFWPEKRFKEGISFKLAHNMNSIGSRFKRLFKRGSTDTGEISFHLYRAKDRISLVRSDLGSLFNITKDTSHLLGSKVVIFLVDSSRLGSLNKIDEVYGSIYDHLAGKVRPLPIVIFTKFDLVSKDRLKKIDLLHKPPMLEKKKARRKYGNKLLGSFMPQMHRSLKGTDTNYFFTDVSVEKDEEGNYVPQASMDIDEEIFFSYEEYKALIEHFGHLLDEQ